MLESDMITVMGHVITVIEHQARFSYEMNAELNWCEWWSEIEIVQWKSWKYERDDIGKLYYTYLQKIVEKKKEREGGEGGGCEREKNVQHLRKYNKSTCFFPYHISTNMFSIFRAQSAKSKSIFSLLIWFQYSSVSCMWQISRAECIPTKRQLIWWGFFSASVEYPYYEGDMIGEIKIWVGGGNMKVFEVDVKRYFPFLSIIKSTKLAPIHIYCMNNVWCFSTFIF